MAVRSWMVLTLTCSLLSAHAGVVLVEDGRSEFTLAVVSPKSPAAVFAGQELARYVRAMTGYTLTGGAVSATQPAILVGLRGELPAAAAANLPAPASGYDGYSLVIEPARIVIAGENGRGVLYGVYDLLERAGCRWFYPQQDPADRELVPRLRRLELDATRVGIASPMRIRVANPSGWFFDMDVAAASAQLDWAAKCRYNTLGWQCQTRMPIVAQYRKMQDAGLLAELDRRELWLHGPGHCFDQLLSATDYFQQHPEWFGLRDGKRVPQNFFGAQFCWSNPEARAQFARNVQAFHAACPHLDILYIVPFDGGRACACQECTETGASNALMRVMSAVLDRLQRSAPDVRVETVGGYSPVVEPPTGEKLHSRQAILWAHWGRYHGYGYDDPRYTHKANLLAWQAAAPAGVTVGQYYCDNFAEPWIMPPFCTVMEGDRRFFLERGFESAYVLMWSPGFWWNHGLNGWLAGRCLYDASSDLLALLPDYANTYYGPKAGPLVARYLDEWARDVDLAYHLRGGCSDAERATLARQRKEFLEPARAAVEGDRLLSYRLNKLVQLHALAEQLAELQRRCGEVKRLREAGKVEDARAQLAEARSGRDRTLAMMERLAALHTGLLDENDVKGFHGLAVKNWVEAEAKALGE